MSYMFTECQNLRSIPLLDCSKLNVIDYMFNQDTLRGEFELETAYMNIDEFMVFGNSKESTSNTSSTAASGVIQVPSNLNLNFPR